MVPHVNTATLLVELDHRHQQAAMQRLASACKRNHRTYAGRLRWAVGSVLLQTGTLVVGDDALVRSNVTSGG